MPEVPMRPNNELFEKRKNPDFPPRIEIFTPKFSYHEVHFLVISGLEKALQLPQVIGHRVGNIGELDSDDISYGGGRARLGHFHCSDPLLNAIYRTSLWTKANLVPPGLQAKASPKA